MKPVRVLIVGCDGATVLNIDATDSDLEFLKRLAAQSVERSKFSCMPTLRLEQVPEPENEE